jgi:ELWxxDGT repeat protein
VADIAPGAKSSTPTDLTSLGGVAFFTADDGTAGVELWVSDGTGPGTRLVKDIAPGSVGSTPASFCVASGALWFAANDPATGTQGAIADPLGAFFGVLCFSDGRRVVVGY